VDNPPPADHNAVQLQNQDQGNQAALIAALTAALNQNNQHQEQGTIRLPQIDVCTFDGNATQWFSFWDLFHSVIHDRANLSPIQKLSYLKTRLVGKAVELLKDLPITVTNYQPTLDLLWRRFENTETLEAQAFHLLQNLCSVRPQNYFDLEHFVNKAEPVLRSLNRPDQPLLPQTDHVLYMSYLRPKLTDFFLDPYLRQLGVGVQPTATNLIAFLVEELRKHPHRLQSSPNRPTSHGQDVPNRTAFPYNTGRKQISSAPAPIHATTTAVQPKTPCAFCGGKHWHQACSTYVTAQQRYDFALKNNLCLLCLRSGHRAADCTLNRLCRLCHRRHRVHQRRTGTL